jgi:hypothetical protein
MAHKLAAAFQ